MNSKTRKRIWPAALMPLAVLGVVAVVVALSAMGPQSIQAQTATADCASITDAISRAQCNTCQNENGVWNTATNMCETSTTGGGGGNGGNGGGNGGGGNGGGTTPPATRPSGSADSDLPGMVQNLMVEAHIAAEGGIPQEQLKISWDPPTEGGAVVSYRIDLSLDGERWHSYINDHGSSDLRVIYGDEDDPDANEQPLNALTNRHFRVFAYNQEGTGPGVSASGATTASWVPDPVSGLTATPSQGCIDGNKAIDLEWIAPEDPPGADVTGYRIQWSSDGMRWHVLEANVPAMETYRNVGMLASTTRHYRIYAINSVGESLVSENSAFATSEASHVPDLPEAIEYILLSPDSTDVHIKWMEPADPCGDAVSDYQFQATHSGADDWRNLHTGLYTDRQRLNGLYVFGGDDLTRAEVTGPSGVFEAGTLVDIRLRTVNRTGTSQDWLVIEEVPIGDSNLPRRQGNPRVEQDQEQNQGRSGLNISWPPAQFNAGKAPADNTGEYSADVRYVLAIGGKEEANGHSQRIEVPRSGDQYAMGTSRQHVGADASRQMTNDDALSAEKTREYQVFPIRNPADLEGNLRIMGTGVSTNTTDVIRGFPSAMVSGTTAPPLKPGIPEDLTATAGGHTEIDLRWSEPMENPDRVCSAEGTTRHVRLGASAPGPDLEDDGSECGESVITGYRVDISETGVSGWTMLATVGPDKNKMIPTSYTAVDLTPGMRYYFRVAAINSQGAGNPTNHVSSDTDTPDKPTPPGGLVAQAMSQTQIKMCWFEHNLVDPLTGMAILDEGLPVLGYRITYLDADGNEVLLVSHTMSTETVYEDPSTLTAGSSRTYRVRSITLGNVGLVDGDDITLGGTRFSEASAMTYPAVAPGMPTALSATAASDMQINLGWNAPADNGGAEIMGYVLDRKSGDGEFMTIAATDAASWWNALDCPMMNDAVQDHVASGDPAVGPDNMTSPYCALYAGLSDAAEAVVDRAFAASGYATITGTSHMDMGLMEMTEYTYQVKAVNSAGASMASATAMATTMRTNAAPVAGDDLTATVTAGETVMVQSMFTDADPEDMTLSYGATTSNSAIATATVDAMGEVTIMGVAMGTATIKVTATDTMGAYDMQDIVVTVNAAAPAVLMPPTGIMSTVAGNVVTITWGGGENATTFTVAMIRRDENGAWDIPNAVYDTGVSGSPHVVNMATRPAGSYHVFVVAGDGAGDWTNWVTGSVNYQP